MPHQDCIALASDHGGYAYKEKAKQLLDSLGLAWEDFGAFGEEPVDYPDTAHLASEAIVSGRCNRGIFICGSGLGIGITANKHRGIRAASCQIPEAARLSRLHNDANVLALGQRLTDWITAEEMIRIFLTTQFEAGRHVQRVNKIELLDADQTPEPKNSSAD